MRKSLSMKKFALTTRMSSRKLMKQLSALSLTSTQTVETSVKDEASTSPSFRPKKSVQFNEEENEWYYPEDKEGNEIQLSSSDVETLWYNGHDIQTMRQDAVRIASKWATHADSGKPTSLAKTLTRAYEATTDKQAMRALKDTSILSSSSLILMIGLESWIVRKKSVDDRRHAAVQAVLSCQNNALHESSPSLSSCWVEKMRHAYRVHGKPSAVFAAQLAAKAWQQEH